jgi:cytochrome d ubiquinol oxidase subunit I
MEALILARIQIAMQLTFHIIFPTINIGLIGYIILFEGLWLKTGKTIYYDLARFFSKIFALAFGLGVVSGITLSFMFGTNFSKFSQATANVIAPLLSYEVLTAFFVEATFLGVMLFGWRKVTPRWHFFSSIIVGLGTLLSAFWIIAANSWMHTPQGFRLENGIFYPVSWSAIIFNPSFVYRYFHMTFAALISGTTIVLGITAYYLLQNREVAFSRIAFNKASLALMFLLPTQIAIGDLHGLNTFKHQPYKVSAMEGRWETMSGAPLVLFGIPDKTEETNHWTVEIPKGASVLLTHELEGKVPGLKEIPRSERPNTPMVFYSFRVMVGIGFILLLVAIYGMYLRLKDEELLYSSRNFLRICLVTSPLGIIATIAGWYVTECGRTPWVVYNLMRVEEAVSDLPWQALLWSLISFASLYLVLMAVFIYYLFKFISKGPETYKASDIQPHEVYKTAWLDPENEK